MNIKEIKSLITFLIYTLLIKKNNYINKKYIIFFILFTFNISLYNFYIIIYI